jgi:hypothetical protein
MTDISVLFVGNSYTYCQRMPDILKGLADGADSPVRIETETCVQGGVTLAWHGRKGSIEERLSATKPDAVVLQEQSRRPVENREAMYEAAAALHEVIQQAGARTVLFMTWARRDEPDMHHPLERTYTDIARKLDAEVAPVGIAWKIAREKPDAPTLYEEDGSHPTAAGAYLTACTFYATLTGNDPAGLLASIEADGETLVDLTPEQARALQEAAREAIHTLA